MWHGGWVCPPVAGESGLLSCPASFLLDIGGFLKAKLGYKLKKQLFETHNG
jgi:hypothetical protein